VRHERLEIDVPAVQQPDRDGPRVSEGASRRGVDDGQAAIDVVELEDAQLVGWIEIDGDQRVERAAPEQLDQPEPHEAAARDRDSVACLHVRVVQTSDGVVGSDDARKYFAAFDYIAPSAGTYRLRVTSFESIDTGELVVTRG
jgi:hypothetical protein